MTGLLEMFNIVRPLASRSEHAVLTEQFLQLMHILLCGGFMLCAPHPPQAPRFSDVPACMSSSLLQPERYKTA